MNTTKVNCLHCNCEFLAKNSELKRGRAKYCSLKCVGASSQKRKKTKENNCICNFCKKEFYRAENKKKNSSSGFQFCKRECKDKAQRLESGFNSIHPSHYSTGKYVKYRTKALSELINECNRCGYKENILALQVHHIDGNRKNNLLKNLEILCANCHVIEHLSSGF